MRPKSIVRLGLRIVALTILYVVCFAIANNIAFGVFGVVISQPGSEASGAAVPALVAVSFLNTAVLAHVILRSRWSGWKLAATACLALYGVMTFMSQIETAAFPAVANRLPPRALPAIFAAGILLAVPYAPLAVLTLGKWKKDPPANGPNTRLEMPSGEWAWKLPVIAVTYVILYFTFGYFIAWRNPAVQAYYGGTDAGSFFLQLGSLIRETPWLPFFQLLRAMLWTLIALPVIRMMKGSEWECALAVGLLFAVLMNSQLLFPNPFMPREVSTTHLIETASSNFIFGMIAARLLLWQPHRARQWSSPAAPAR